MDNMNEIRDSLLKKGFIDVTGDACVGDIVHYVHVLWGGSYRKPKFLGKEVRRVAILKDSYGAEKQQHTFTVAEIDENGNQGKPYRIKGRNLYREFTICENYDRPDRRQALEDKHKRGEAARKERDRRRAASYYNAYGYDDDDDC